MSNRDTYIASLKTAAQTKRDAVAAAVTTKQVTIDAARSVTGYTTQTGSQATLDAAIKTANQGFWDSSFAAEQAKQAAIAVARDTLRNAGGDSSAF
jgi:hypothetical protein